MNLFLLNECNKIEIKFSVLRDLLTVKQKMGGGEIMSFRMKTTDTPDVQTIRHAPCYSIRVQFFFVQKIENKVHLPLGGA